MVSAYAPTIVPSDLNDPIKLQRWLSEELKLVAAGMDRANTVALDPQFVLPTKPEEGNIFYADGVSWNPGSGEGYYGYVNGAFVFLSTTLTSLGVSAYIQTLLDDANATVALATLGIVVGTWTPTLTNVANVAASTVHVGMYTRIGNIVQCAIQIEIDPTLAAPTFTQYRLSLPIASNFSAIDQAAGVMASRGNSAFGEVQSVAATDDVTVFFNSNATVNNSQDVLFSYQVI